MLKFVRFFSAAILSTFVASQAVYASDDENDDPYLTSSVPRGQLPVPGFDSSSSYSSPAKGDLSPWVTPRSVGRDITNIRGQSKAKPNLKRDRSTDELDENDDSFVVPDNQADPAVLEELAKIVQSFQGSGQADVDNQHQYKITHDEFDAIMKKLKTSSDEELKNDISVLFGPHARLVVLDNEWDRNRHVTEISAIEVMNGKRGQIKFSKYDANNPARNDLRRWLNFIKHDAVDGYITVVVAHNAPADYSILLYEMFKHFERPPVHDRILEHENYTTFWFDSCQFIKRAKLIAEGKKDEQVKIKTINFSKPTADQKRTKSIEDSKKRREAKQRKAKREAAEKDLKEGLIIEKVLDLADGEQSLELIDRVMNLSGEDLDVALELIDRVELQADGSYIFNIEETSDTDDQDDVVSSPKFSAKLRDAFNRTGYNIDSFMKYLRMHDDLAKEKGVPAGQFADHNALYDIIMTLAVLHNAKRDADIADPAACVKRLKFAAE